MSFGTGIVSLGGRKATARYMQVWMLASPWRVRLWVSFLFLRYWVGSRSIFERLRGYESINSYCYFCLRGLFLPIL